MNQQITLGNLFLWTDLLNLVIWMLTLFLAFRFGKRMGIREEKENTFMEWIKRKLDYDE